MKATDIKAEIEAIHQEIETLKKANLNLINIINTNKDVLFDLIEELKKAKIPYRDEYAGGSFEKDLY